MTLEDLLAILERIGVEESDVILRREGQLQIPCPLAPWFHAHKTDDKPSLSIKYSDDEPTLFKCFACLEKGKLSDLVDSYANLKKDEDLKKFAITLQLNDKPTLSDKLRKAGKDIETWVRSSDKPKQIHIHKDALDNFIPALDVAISRNYLKERRVSDDVAKEFQLKYDSRQGRLVFPLFNIENQLIGAVGRTLVNDCRKYYNYFGFQATAALGGINYTNPVNRRILLVEGFFCLVHAIEWCRELGYDIVCAWHGDLSSQQAELLINLDKTVYCCYDNDPTGNRGWEKVQQLLLGNLPVKRARLQPKKDIGNLTKAEFVQLLTQLSSSLKLGV